MTPLQRWKELRRYCFVLANIEPVIGNKCVRFGAQYFAKNCSVTTVDGIACLRCKYTRRLVQNQLNRLKKKRIKNFKQRMTRKSLELFRARKKLANAHRSIEELRTVNEGIASSALEKKLSGLPPKQRLAVKTCFEAAARKSSRGMCYDKLWVLECILMRMKSPKLYEHVRRYEIMALPSNSCLDKHIQGFKSAFGFNESVISSLREKTQEMDKFDCHGGLVYDEMKLSENINVKVSGELTGFVDLGPLTDGSTNTARGIDRSGTSLASKVRYFYFTSTKLSRVWHPFLRPFSFYICSFFQGNCLPSSASR